jgi:hypothetical protein
MTDKQRENLRDRFAMAALTGMLSNSSNGHGVNDGKTDNALYARLAYWFADGMMETRDIKE